MNNKSQEEEEISNNVRSRWGPVAESNNDTTRWP